MFPDFYSFLLIFTDHKPSKNKTQPHCSSFFLETLKKHNYLKL